MRLLYVHERIGALGGAEVNILATAQALRKRGHTLGLAHGGRHGRDEPEWREAFPYRIARDESAGTRGIGLALAQFEPDVIYLNKFSNPDVLALLADCGCRGGARLVLDKRLPLAAGLGGGSADAGAVFHGKVDVLEQRRSAELFGHGLCVENRRHLHRFVRINSLDYA